MFNVLRYEDLVDDTIKVLKRVYSFLDLTFDDAVRRSVRRHKEADDDAEAAAQWYKYYYSAYRPSGFRHDDWKKQLKKKVAL